MLQPSAFLYSARALRDFGDGFVAVLLPVYLGALGLSPLQIGVVATVALFGSALMTLAVGFAKRAQKTLLVASSILMFATGLAFASVQAYPAILLVALLGTVNPSSGSVSIFVPMEQSALARMAADTERTKAFARYSLIGAISAAAGSLASASPELLAEVGISKLAGLRLMFVLYAILGIASGFFYHHLPLDADTTGNARKPAHLGPSRRIVYKLAGLFSIDAFAGGFVVQSLLALWLFTSFDLSLAQAGVFFFWSGLLSAISFPIAAWLAQKIGLINTMVFTHIPSSFCLIFAAISPSLELALGLLLMRSLLSQMDVPTRTSYVMAVVTPTERTAAASITSVPRSLAAAASPAIAGAMFTAGLQAWPLIICDALKIVYDLLLLWIFRNVRPPEEAR
jgi:MFS family permease